MAGLGDPLLVRNVDVGGAITICDGLHVEIGSAQCHGHPAGSHTAVQEDPQPTHAAKSSARSATSTTWSTGRSKSSATSAMSSPARRRDSTAYSGAPDRAKYGTPKLISGSMS